MSLVFKWLSGWTTRPSFIITHFIHEEKTEKKTFSRNDATPGARRHIICEAPSTARREAFLLFTDRGGYIY